MTTCKNVECNNSATPSGDGSRLELCFPCLIQWRRDYQTIYRSENRDILKRKIKQVQEKKKIVPKGMPMITKHRKYVPMSLSHVQGTEKIIKIANEILRRM